jgi:hypothetical protein
MQRLPSTPLTVKSIEESKASPDFNPADHRRDCKIHYVDVTGGAASAKLEIITPMTGEAISP